jgi:hypothetical protein
MARAGEGNKDNQENVALRIEALGCRLAAHAAARCASQEQLRRRVVYPIHPAGTQEIRFNQEAPSMTAVGQAHKNSHADCNCERDERAMLDFLGKAA